jgi:hypothetical protein
MSLFTPLAAKADTASNKKKIQSLFKQLKGLPNQGAPNAKVFQIVTQLAKLDPNKAFTYVNLGLTKLTPGTNNVATALLIQKTVTNSLKKSGLTPGKIASLQKNINRTVQNYTSHPPATPTPTPVSPVSMVLSAVPVA